MDKYDIDAGLTKPGQVCNCLEAWYGTGGTINPKGRKISKMALVLGQVKISQCGCSDTD